MFINLVRECPVLCFSSIESERFINFKSIFIFNMNILITGGSGFIGSHIAEELSKKHDVVVFDNLSTGHKSNLKGLKVKFVKGDITNYSSVLKAMKGIDAVFHLAAQVSVPESIKKPRLAYKINVVGLENVLKAALKNKVSKVVYTSSCAVYGDNPKLPLNEAAKKYPMSPYAKTKLIGEVLCAKYEKKGLKTATLRYFNVFGERQDPESQYAAAIPIFMKKALKNQEITIFGDGKQTRDFVYVKDVVKANLLAFSKGKGVYNVGTGKPVVIHDLAKKIVLYTKSKSKISFLPAREGDIKHSLSDIKRIQKIGFVADTHFDKNLKKTVGWFKKVIK